MNRIRLLTGKRSAWDPYAVPRSILPGFWWADDHGTPLMTDDGSGLISSWSGRINGLPAAGTTSSRPTWGATAFDGVHSALAFDGVANRLLNTAFTALPTGSAPGGVMVVASPSDNGGTQQVVFAYGSTSATARRILIGAVDTAKVDDGSTALSGPNGIGPHIISGFWSGTTMTGRCDGTEFGSATIATLNTATTRLYFGNTLTPAVGQSFKGAIRGVFVYTDRTIVPSLEGWAAWNSGLQGNLPSNHPYKGTPP